MKAIVKQRIWYVVGDMLACELATLLFNLARHWRIHAQSHLSFADWSSDVHVMVGYLAFPAVMIAVFALLGFYNDPQYKSRYEALVNAATGSVVGALIIYFAIVVNDNFSERSLHYSLLITLCLSYFVPVALVRFAIRAVLLKRACDGDDTFNVMIVGSIPEAMAYACRLEKANRRMGYRVVGIVDSGSVSDSGHDGCYSIYRYDDLNAVISKLNVKAFVVMASRDQRERSLDAIKRMYAFGVTILLPIDFYSVITSRPKLSNIIGEPLVDITTPALSPAASNLKRMGDIIISFAAMVALMPVAVVIALIIKLDSRGPVFYRQERVGLHRRKFRIVKFRSMIDMAEANGPELSRNNDCRITRVGHVLRKYRLDELPQFWNVFRGDMSLVGPRPEREYFLEQLARREPAVCTLHNVRPGLTSLGMVKFGYATDLQEMTDRLYFDLLYVENISFSLDLRIMFHTVNTVITGKGI